MYVYVVYRIQIWIMPKSLFGERELLFFVNMRIILWYDPRIKMNDRQWFHNKFWIFSLTYKTSARSSKPEFCIAIIFPFRMRFDQKFLSKTTPRNKYTFNTYANRSYFATTQSLEKCVKKMCGADVRYYPFYYLYKFRFYNYEQLLTEVPHKCPYTQTHSHTSRRNDLILMPIFDLWIADTDIFPQPTQTRPPLFQYKVKGRRGFFFFIHDLPAWKRSYPRHHYRRTIVSGPQMDPKNPRHEIDSPWLSMQKEM